MFLRGNAVHMVAVSLQILRIKYACVNTTETHSTQMFIIYIKPLELQKLLRVVTIFVRAWRIKGEEHSTLLKHSIERLFVCRN